MCNRIFNRYRLSLLLLALGNNLCCSHDDIETQLPDDELKPYLVMQHAGAINCARFSASETSILTSSDDGTAKLWELNNLIRDSSGNVFPDLQGIMPHPQAVQCAIFSPHSNSVATISDQTVRIWDLGIVSKNETTGISYFTGLQAQFNLTDAEGGTPAEFNPIAFHPEQNWLLGVANNASVWTLVDDERTPQAMMSLPHDAAVLHAHFAPASLGGEVSKATVITSSMDNTAVLWGLYEGDSTQVFTLPTDAPENTNSSALAPTSTSTSTPTPTSTSTSTPAATNVPTVPSSQAPSFPPTVTIPIKTLEAAKLAVMHHGGAVVFSVLHPDQRRLMTVAESGEATIWDLSQIGDDMQPAIVATLNHNSPVRHGAFNNDGSLLATASGHQALIWNTTNIGNDYMGKATYSLLALVTQDNPVLFVVFTNNQKLLTTSEGDNAKLWNLDEVTLNDDNIPEPGLLATFPSEGDVSFAEFNSDEHLLVTGSDDWKARLWNVSEFTANETLSSSSNSGLIAGLTAGLGLPVVVATGVLVLVGSYCGAKKRKVKTVVTPQD
ncbi:MAG: WD40 repeat domain-containing protein [Endozoicomonas sp.]|uniref:WD40 repeat domain-containing protein n=1 Tax=Endozoicomonas sp. TaxID=1892382 RepID=UPI003D9B4DBF